LCSIALLVLLFLLMLGLLLPSLRMLGLLGLLGSSMRLAMRLLLLWLKGMSQQWSHSQARPPE